MNLENISNADLVTRMEKLVRTERKITHLILLHIIEIETRRIYADLGYDGMYTYLTRGLGYSEAAAYRRLQSARLLRKVPDVSEKIESGVLHLTQLTQVQKCIKQSAIKGQQISSAEALDVLHKLENKNTFETEKFLAQEFSLPIKAHEILKPQKDDSVRLEITLTSEQFQELKAAKESLSHVCIDGNWSEVIVALARKFNRAKNSPTRSRADKSKEIHLNFVKDGEDDLTKNKPDLSTQRVIATKLKRKAISAKVKRALLAKANSCCEYISPETGKRCDSKFQLQIDHIKPWAYGGADDPQNLRMLCRTHNLLMARQAGLNKPAAKS